MDEDDEFFHLTCHIELQLRKKIENGEFVELERLLPKGGRLQKFREDCPVWLYEREGETFLAPVERDTKISSVRRWEQAFRIYAAIYCKAHPHRSHEIWQYVYVINHAASFYVWDNVAEYDFVFRQLMSDNPHRSWAKTYTQMWNIALREPIQRGAASSSRNNFSNNSSSTSMDSNNAWKKRCCWKFNKNKCEKDSKSCDWDHRCKYCGGWNHGDFQCKKKLGGKPDEKFTPKSK